MIVTDDKTHQMKQAFHVNVVLRHKSAKSRKQLLVNPVIKLPVQVVYIRGWTTQVHRFSTGDVCLHDWSMKQ